MNQLTRESFKELISNIPKYVANEEQRILSKSRVLSLLIVAFISILPYFFYLLVSFQINSYVQQQLVLFAAVIMSIIPTFLIMLWIGLPASYYSNRFSQFIIDFLVMDIPRYYKNRVKSLLKFRFGEVIKYVSTEVLPVFIPPLLTLATVYFLSSYKLSNLHDLILYGLITTGFLIAIYGWTKLELSKPSLREKEINEKIRGLEEILYTLTN